MSEEWERNYGTPPYSHAELDSVKVFSERLKIDYEAATKRLSEKQIGFDASEPLVDIAARHGVSPQHIYMLISGKDKTSASLPQEGSGMGRKTLSQVCELYGLDVNKVVETLIAQGYHAEPSSKFKEIAEEKGVNPMELHKTITVLKDNKNY